MFKFSAVSQIWKKYIQKLNDWDLSLSQVINAYILHIIWKWLNLGRKNASMLNIIIY